jgi:hypothetical protein
MTYLLDIETLNCFSNIGDKIVPLVQYSSVKIPVFLDTVKDIVLPIVNNISVDTSSSDTILPVLNKSIDVINSTSLTVEPNTVHIEKMEFLAKNYIHIFNMKNIAIDLLCNKVNTCSSSVIQDFNLHNFIPFLLEKCSMSSVTCSWGHS